MIILTGKADSYAQFITVLFIFVAVLAVTALVTKWIAGYQKQQGAAGNIEAVSYTHLDVYKRQEHQCL